MTKEPGNGQEPSGRPGDFWDRYTAFIERRAGIILLVALAVTAASGYLASRLPLKSDFGELLPANAPSLKQMDRIQKRMGGISTLVVAVEGGDWKKREKFVEKVADRLLKEIPRKDLSYVDYKISVARKHFEDNRYLYIDLDDLKELRRRLKKKIDDVRRRKLVIDFEDRPAYKFSIDDIKKKYESKVKDYDHFPDGYFITPDRTLQALLLRIPSSAMAEMSTDSLVQRVRGVIAKLEPAKHGYKILIGGDPVTALEERRGIVEDLLIVSISCILLVILSIVIYYRSLRSLLLIGAPVAVGVPVAFGLAYVFIGHLNSNTAFLGSIIAGNGINFAIIMLARYIEDRRRGENTHHALRVALRQTWLGTATAALAASIAYGSLMVTDFRGFSQFGFIGGIGMIICWLATFTVGPALLVWLERRWPIKIKKPKKEAPAAAKRITAFLGRHHKLLASLGLLLTIGSLVGAALFYRDPFEYDFRKLRSRRSAQSGSSALGARVDKIFHGTRFMAGSPSVIVVDRLDQVRPLVAALKKLKKTSGMIDRAESIFDLLPKNQAAKLPVLREVRELLDKKAIGWMTPEQKKEARKYRPPDKLREIRVKDLPELLLRPFTEKDGRKGLIVYVYPPPGTDYFQGKKLMQFADLIREIKIGEKETIRTSGREIILADILRAVLTDGPIATLASFIGVLILVTFAFRRFRARFVVLASLVGGVAWLCGVGAAMQIKVNMLNFVALPITFGIGVDYAVNVYRRYEHEGPGGIGMALRSTGGAVALCSLTTIIGFSSLLFADTRALNSFGLLALMGEITTLVAALTWMPALIRIVDRRHYRELEALQPQGNGESTASVATLRPSDGDSDDEQRRAPGGE